MLPDGSRLHVVIPDITRRHWAVNIRKFVLPAGSLDELVGLGTLTAQAARFLEAAVVAGLNVIVAGGTQAGKTTMLNCLAGAIPGRERVITCEEVFELRLGLPDVVAMQTRQPNLEGTGEIQLRRLVKEALRMRPDRVIVGEVRQEECLDLLIALNSGLPGMCRLHANSAREAIVKLCTLPLLAGENVGHGFVVPDGGQLRGPGGAPGQGRQRAAAGAGGRRGAGSGGGRRGRGGGPVRHARRAGWCGRRASRRTRSASPGRASTCRRCWRRRADGRAARAAAGSRAAAAVAVPDAACGRGREAGSDVAGADAGPAGAGRVEGVTPAPAGRARALVLGLVVFVVVLGDQPRWR